MHEEINEFTRKSIELARSENYLDQIIKIYPARLLPERPLPADIMVSIQKLYEQGNYQDIVLLLLNLEDYPFPVEHPYASLLRHLSREDRLRVLDKNPELLRELAYVIKELGVEGIIRGVKRPKDINRMLGSAFKSWIKREFIDNPFKVVKSPSKLPTCNQNIICIYVGSDEKISDFIVKNLLLIQSKKDEDEYRDLFRRDILVKVKSKYIVGEARFLSTPGGSQKRDLENALKFLIDCENIRTKNNSQLYGIAIIDGIVWFYKEYLSRITSVARGKRTVLSALLLKQLLFNFFNEPI